MSRTMYQKRDSQTPKRVQVARTLVEPQPDLSNFLDGFGRHMLARLGNQVVVSTLGGLHITLLESRGTTPAFRRKGYTPPDVRDFSTDLQQYLADKEGTRDRLVVEVNLKNPFKWYGWRSNRLALNVAPSPALRQEREYIEEFVHQRLGGLATLGNLDEHVVIASLARRVIKPAEQNNPGLLLAPDLVVPGEIAVNGLMVFINGIGDEDR